MKHIKQYAGEVAAVLFLESTDNQELDKIYSSVSLHMIMMVGHTFPVLENHKSNKELISNWVKKHEK